MLKIKKLYLWSLVALLCVNLSIQSAENEDYIEMPLPQIDDAAKMADQAEPVRQEQSDGQQLLRTAVETLAKATQRPDEPDLSIFKAINRILDQQKVTNITVEQNQSGVTLTLHTSPSNIQVDLNEQQTKALSNTINTILQPQQVSTRQPMPQPNQPATAQAPAIDPNNRPTPPNGPGGPNGSGGPNGPQNPNKKPEDELTKEEQEEAEKKEREDKSKRDKEKNPILYDPRLLEQNKDKKIDPKKDDTPLGNPYYGQQNPGYQNYHPMQNYYQQTQMQQQQPKAVGGSTTDKTAFATQTPKPQTKATTFEERQALVPEGTGKVMQTESRVPEPSNQPRKAIIATPERLEHQKVTDRTSSLKVVLAGPEEPVKIEQPKPQPKLTFFEAISQKITNFFLSCWQFIVNLLPFGK
jgi:hypothetical protein